MFRTLIRHPSARIAGLLALLALLLALVFVVTVPVTRKLQDLSSANSDNVQWTLAQVEVEYFSLKTTLTQDVAAQRTDPNEIRQRFDIFYSRINTLRTATVFSPLRDDPGFSAALTSVWAGLQQAVSLIDASDERLMVARRDLLTDFVALRTDVRALSLGGISTFARLADTRRESVLQTLQLTAGIALALIAGLLLALVVLLQLFQEGRRRGRELKQTTSRLRAIVNTSLAAILVVDKKGRVLDYNGAAEQVFGYTRDEMIGSVMGDMIVPDHLRGAHEAGMTRYIETGEKRVIGKGRVELEAMRKTGEVFPVELSIATAQSEEGEIFVSFLRDISARVQAENDLREARDKAVAGEKAKADLLAVMSHEMRTPLNGLLGTLDLLQQTTLTHAQQTHVRNMLTSGHLLLHHVGDVLEITELEAGTMRLSPSDFDLRALIEDLAASQMQVAQAEGNSLTVMVDPDADRAVHGDPMRLRQVLLNLLGNALKFTKDGAVALEAEALGDGLFEFRVADTGIGISEDDLDRIFDDFVTLDTSYGRVTGGTGLGLGITKRIVDALGGEIGVESEAQEGSLFWVRIPLADAQRPLAGASNGGALALSAYSPALDVLLVEDNAINQEVATALLENLGHQVTLAKDGAEGVARAAERAFDVILMDISMPRLDGVEATRRIRAAGGPNAKTRIVAVTANALPADVAHYTASGMDDVLTKPIRAASLATMLSGAAPVKAEAGTTFDRNVFAELHGIVGDAGVRRLLTEIDSHVAEVQIGLATAEHPGMVEDVHKLAGSVAILGATALHGHLTRLEVALRNGDQQPDTGETAALWDATHQEIRQSFDAAEPS